MYGGSGTSPTRRNACRDHRRRCRAGSRDRRPRHGPPRFHVRPSPKEMGSPRECGRRLARCSANVRASSIGSTRSTSIDAARRSSSMQTRRDDLGVVDDQDVAGAKPIAEPSYRGVTCTIRCRARPPAFGSRRGSEAAAGRSARDRARSRERRDPWANSPRLARKAQGRQLISRIVSEGSDSVLPPIRDQEREWT